MTSRTNPNAGTRPPGRRRKLALATAFGIAIALVLGWWGIDRATTESDLAERRTEVAERGSEVMPFDLAKTTHSFVADDSGGTQTVTANDPADTEQIRLIRLHLREEQRKFLAGDFGDPATIHDDEMPGLAELRSSAGQIDVQYAELSDGARLRYTTTDPTLVTALARWFEAQSTDHGTDAHAPDHTTPN